MNRIRFLAVAAIVAAGLAGCERPVTQQAQAPSASPPSRAQPAPRANGSATGANGASAVAPRPVPRDAITDSVITAKIKSAILSDPGMTGTDVSVNTERGVVSLVGNVKSQEQIAMASAHAQRQDGVMRVDTQLSVNPG